MLIRQPTTAVSRAAEKLGRSWARPPPLPQNEAMPPAGRSTGFHPPRETLAAPTPSWGSARTSEQLHTASQLNERSVYGASPLAQETLRPSSSRSARSARGEPSDETLRFVRNFVSRARGPGPHKLAHLAELLRQAASGEPGFETLTKEEWTKVTMAQGLCRNYHECDLVFSYFERRDLAGQQVVPVLDLVKLARGSLPPHRAALVKEVWNKLDVEGHGIIKVQRLLEEYDVQRLPDVRFGLENVEGARRKLLEGLGVIPSQTPNRGAEYDLEESAARRRPWPIGVPGGGPVAAPAGTTVVRSRNLGDSTNELSARTPMYQMHLELSWPQWEAYFTILSSGIMNDDSFEQTLRDPLITYQAHGRAQAERVIMAPSARKKKCELRLLGTFEDGSKRVLILRDDDFLEHLSGNAGTGDGQFWTWGPTVYKEVMRRFKAQGVEGLKSLALKPF